VLDNSNHPIPGVTMRAVLTNVLNANGNAVQSVPAVQTDSQGQFTIGQAPVGFVKLLADGSTAQIPGVYPSLEYDLVTVAGQKNTVGQPIYLLPLDPRNQLCVTATSGGGTLTIPDAPGFSLTFGPGQVTFPGGSKTGCVSVTVVHGDKVPMMPGFGQQPRFIVTIQPSGAVFNPPAPITLPNVDGLKPREVTEMYSFDHDIGSFVAIGTGVVSADGQIIRSSAGVGVLKAGWHCGGNPVTSGAVANCPTCQICNGTQCLPDDTQAPPDVCDQCQGGATVHRTSIDVPFPAINSAVAQVPPTKALDACDWGMTWPESISFDISARCDGGNWRAVLTSLTGDYSQQARLLPGFSEVTGPNGNTTQANYCAQASDLQALGKSCNSSWYMLSAVQAHEDVHLAHFQPALVLVASILEAWVESLTVPTAPGKTEAQAIAEIKALPGYAAIAQNAYLTWKASVISALADDHLSGGATDVAERNVIRTMVNSICSYAKAQGWSSASCSACPL